MIHFKNKSIRCLHPITLSVRWLTALSAIVISASLSSQGKIKSGILSSPVRQACTCTLTQGSFSTPIDFMIGSQTPTTFYNYTGSSGNTGLEQSNTALFMLYEGGGETALITLLDALNDGSGGGASIEYSCLPSGAFVAFSDDGGELSGAAPTIMGNFNWQPCCVDGGVISGVGCGDSFVINPSFSSGIGLIRIVSGTPSMPVYTDLQDLNCPIVIDCGGTVCCDEAFEFSGTVQNATCSYSTNGSVQLNVQCAASPTFGWSNGETTKNISGLSPGAYTVTITAAGGCTATATYTVGTSSQTPDPEITGAPLFCEGESVNLGVNGAFNSYAWSNGDFGPVITITQPGEYTVTVSNTSGCTGTASTTIVMNPAPEVTIEGTLELCPGESVTLDAGPGFLQYVWSNGYFSQTTTVSTPGQYVVTVFNTNGCIGSDEVTVVPKPAPQPIINGPSTLCAGTTITLNAGDDFITYSWSSGVSGQTTPITSGGLYTVTVTNEAGCSGTDEHVVVQNSSDTIKLRETSCNPLDTGTFFTPYTNAAGCPSLRIRTVSFAARDSVVMTRTTCVVQDTGIVIRRLKNRYGCDSIHVRITRFLASDLTLLESRSCLPQDTGRWEQVLKNKNGCDSIVRRITSLLRSDSIVRQEKTCIPSQVGTQIYRFKNSDGCDSTVVVLTTFSLSDTTFLIKKTCDINAIGTRERLLTNTEGCDSLVIEETIWQPSDTTRISNLSCVQSEAGLTVRKLPNRFGCDSLIYEETRWQKPDTTLFINQTCLPADTGYTEKIVKNRFGCDSLIITRTLLFPSTQCILQVTAQGDTLQCNQSSGAIRVSLREGSPPFRYQWRETAGLSGNGILPALTPNGLIQGLPPGVYQVTITDQMGLEGQLTARIIVPQPLMASARAINLHQGFGVSCAGLSDGIASVEVAAGGLGPFRYSWSSGQSSQSVQNLGMGWYTVTVSGAFACTDTDSVYISSPPPLQLSVSVESPDCRTNGKGAVRITALTGGAGGYSVTLNGAAANGAGSLENLLPGRYTLVVTDANGCTRKAEAELKDITPPVLQLGQDTIIQKGATITLRPVISVTEGAIDTLYWEGIECPGCVDITIRPDATITLTVVVEDTLGCRTSDKITINVAENEEISVPNIFSPDGDGTNDRFTIYGGEGLLRIQTMTIYDRWGNQIFSAEDIPPGDPTFGWDGTIAGRQPVTGVYLYTCTLQLTGNKTTRLSGDVTVTR